ncbi:hypothetical protein Nepgr_015501 [Nepenthes gracilis]|uniref:Protein odr-4 homolog n=1 Tax=Nepenthes gracilis TaxID=150966 RepID=A0AAD3SMZ3_NEPGR|nr:hypothetical protein Nepgr_015501 [Nepenthes gracilis]
MVKTVVGEETQLQLAELRLSQSGIFAQVGLVIGKLSSILDKGFVFDLIPTPPNDAGEPPCSLVDSFKDVDKKKGSKAKSSADSSSLVIDEGWVTEHARQVSRMLVGGIRVIGIYVWIGESTFKNSTITLCQTVKGVAEAAPLSASDWDERLLVHICYSPRRWTCRNCSLASNITPSHLRPCDFKMGKVLGTLQSFRCMYNFDMRLPIYQENMSSIRTLNDILQNEISIHAKELKGAKGLVDGNLVIEDEPCTSDGQHKVELLLPFMKDACLEASSQKEIVGVLVFAGSVCSYAYLNSKQPISEALADIKEDIIMSLRSRLDIICDEADRQTGVTADGVTEENNEMPTLETVHQLILEPLRKQATLQLPRRIFIPWLAGTFICDYLQPSETFEVLKDHFVELLSMEPPADASTILEPETGTPSLSIQSFWAVAAPLYPASVPESLANSPPERRPCITHFHAIFHWQRI